MALNLPSTASEVDQRSRVDVGREIENSNPFLRNSWLGALVSAFANRIFDFYLALEQAALEAIPDTADINLEQWAAIWNILRQPATAANGRVAVGGTITGTVPVDTLFVSTDGAQYRATSAGSIINQVLAVTSITRVGTTATLTTTNDHLLASNIVIDVTGAVQTEYNVIGAAIIVTGATTLTYQVTGTPATPATGTILLDADFVSIPVDSIAFGADQNQLADSPLTLQSPIADVDDTNNVDSGSLGGGTDQELDAALLIRFLDRIQNPIAHFNDDEITAVAKAVAGVTRVFVQEITPDVGQVTIYFMRDNDVSSIPDASEVADVKAAIDAIKPANTDTLDVIVAAPDPESTDYTFSAISPDTTTMRDAITASLAAFYEERADVGVTIVEEAYNAAIFNTVDLITGQELASFTLTVPTTDITIAAGEIGILGNVTYPA